MYKYKIIKREYTNTKPDYYIKVRHPWFNWLWMYLAKYTSKYYFTTINYKTKFYSLEEAKKRINEHKEDRKRLKEYVNSETKIIEKL